MGTADVRSRKPGVKQPASEYRDSALWSGVEAIVAELTATEEVTINTAPDYVVAQICQELVAKKLISEAAVRSPRQRDAHS